MFAAEAARRAHVSLGYDERRMVVVPNGFDPATWRPDAEARLAVRRELGLEPSTPIVGLVARVHPQKDHRNFLAAAPRIAAAAPDVVFVLCGEGVERSNPRLADVVAGLALLGGGALAWVRRPRAGAGLLMLLSGVAWFAGDLWSALLYAHRGPLVHLLLTYPSGRTSSRITILVIAAAYVGGLVPALAEKMLAEKLRGGRGRAPGRRRPGRRSR